MKKEYIIDKGFIENNYKRQFDQLKTMFGNDWYLKKDGVEYCLIVGNCEISFISMKWDFAGIVDGIEFGLLCGKHIDKWFRLSKNQNKQKENGQNGKITKEIKKNFLYLKTR